MGDRGSHQRYENRGIISPNAVLAKSNPEAEGDKDTGQDHQSGACDVELVPIVLKNVRRVSHAEGVGDKGLVRHGRRGDGR